MPDAIPDYGISFSSSLNKKSISTLNLSAEQHAERFILEQISDPNYNHELSASQLWAIKTDDTFHLLTAHPDVYEMLQSEFNLSSYKGVIIHTTGWAAPLGENGELEGAPSKHDLRRRVALAACVTSSSVGSALSFSDDKEIILDPGSATGSLADALLKFWENNIID
jgi:hypothetical protein